MDFILPVSLPVLPSACIRAAQTGRTAVRFVIGGYKSLLKKFTFGYNRGKISVTSRKVAGMFLSCWQYYIAIKGLSSTGMVSGC